MSTTYNKATNFATKDSLATGNALKIIKGTELDDEFNRISNAVNAKADINSPVFTGTPTAPTAASTTNTLQLATTAFVQQEITANATTAATIVDTVYPVGSIYISTVATNPGTLLGRGTWEAFATGKTLVGIDAADEDFDTVEETGGAKTHTLTLDEIPSHRHLGGNHTQYGTGTSSGSGLTNHEGTGAAGKRYYTDYQGGGSAHNNLQPYIVTYMWKRTA
jgi:hypothetical protein